MHKSILRVITLCSCFFIVFLMGCSSDYYRKDADKEVYSILKNKQKTVLGKEVPFSLEDYTGRPEVKAEELKLNLRNSLKIATRHSRSFQDQRESLYKTTLQLTSDRHDFDPTFLASLQASISGDKNSSRGGVTGTAGINKLWKWGLFSPVTFSTNLLRSFTSNPMDVANSTLSATITQPLFRGFGTKIAAENLTQSERTVIYQVRSFERFRKTFAVSITSSYFKALQNYDAVKNAQSNLKNTKLNYEQLKEEAKWGRVEKFQLDQAETSYLSAQDGVNTAEKGLQDSLDNFKLLLGIPLEQKIALDVKELENLHAAGFEKFGLKSGEAQEIALNCRLDMANSHDYVEDSKRNLVIMEDQLRTQLDLTGTVTVNSEEGKPGKLKAEDFRYENVGLKLNLPFDRKRERNAYRSALIGLEKQKRTLEEKEDTVRLDVVSSLRNLGKAQRSYKIQLKSLNLAKERVESTQVLRKYGQVQIRDYLEAQQEELRAENSLTRSLIDYHLAYLDCLLSLGIMEIDRDGVFVDFAFKKDGNIKEEGNNAKSKKES